MRKIAGALVLATSSFVTGTAAQQPPPLDTGPGNLIAVLRGSLGGLQQRETLQPYGSVQVELPDGSEVELETSWFRYVGDLHIRLVFDSPAELQSASPGDLDRLRLAPAQAVQLAVSNLRRTYGEPSTEAWSGGLTRVTGRADDLNSSYFLDRTFWQQLESSHPAGLVVAVPQRGGLLYAPAGDEEAVAALRFSVAALYESARRQRVSSALYLFKDGQWSMFQPPMPR